MANQTLFRSPQNGRTNRTNCFNEAGGRSYAFKSEHALAQYAATGCLNDTFYASADMQLDTVLRLCERCSPEFIAQTAIYARNKGYMKDMPALLCAVLSTRSPKLLAQIFDRVIDDAKMIRNFVQIMRSGVVGRRSLGTLPKRLVRNWIERQSVQRLFTASVGNDPSLVDIIRMVHPKPGTPQRKAFFGYLLGKDFDADELPEIVKEYEAYKKTLEQGKTAKSLPKVPFQMLTSQPLSPYEWLQIARNASWQTTRMNLNAFARNGVFENVELGHDAEKKFPVVDPWRVRIDLEEPKKPAPFVYIPRHSIFEGCGNAAIEEFVRQFEEEDRRKEETAWQKRWQDYRRAREEFEEKKRDLDAAHQKEVERLEAERREKIARFVEEENRRLGTMLNRARKQSHLLKAARKELVPMLVDRLRNPEQIARSKVFPYQIMTAFLNAQNIPEEIRTALEEAMEIATANIPAVDGKLYVFPDLSGSMWTPATGYRRGATSKVQCVDIAALVSAAMLRKNPTAEVVPFGTDVALIELNPNDSVMANAKKMAAHCAGGTNCSAPLRYLNERKATGDLVVYVSDNESWIDSSRLWGDATETVRQWNIFKYRNPSAKMICIDIQPYGSTQAEEREDIVNVGGFSDQVFGLIADIAAGEGKDYWIRTIKQTPME